MKEAIGNSLAYGLTQIYKKVMHVNENMIGLERFANVTDFYGIVISFDDTYNLNNEFIRDITTEILNENDVHFDNIWQLMTIRELENLVAICDEENNFLDLLTSKLSEDNLIYMDFDHFLGYKEIELKDNELITLGIQTMIDSQNPTDLSEE